MNNKIKISIKSDVEDEISIDGFSHIDLNYFNEQNANMIENCDLSTKEKKYFAFIIKSKDNEVGDSLELIEFNINDYHNFLLYKPTKKSRNLIPIFEPKKFRRIVIDFPYIETNFINYNEQYYMNMSKQTGIIINQIENGYRKGDLNHPFGIFSVKQVELLIPEDYSIGDSIMVEHYR